MNELNPTSVNTIRVITILKMKMFISLVLIKNDKGSIVDNFASGG